MGTLIGAPLGIALAAGVVLPAMVIGIPVYVGRQVRACYSQHLITTFKCTCKTLTRLDNRVLFGFG